MATPSGGFALRTNGTCQADEVNCGETVAPFHACCPASTFCPSQYNVNCCPTSANCTSALVKKPTCADTSWDLYDNGGYFCCLRRYTGFATPDRTDGCASPGYAFSNGEVLLSIVSKGQAPTSSTSSRSSSRTSTAAAKTTKPTSSSSASPSTDFVSDRATNRGAIAGGVIGGICAVVLVLAAIWWFMRRRKRGGGINKAGHNGEDKEIQSREVMEMDGSGQFARLKTPMPASSPPSELDSPRPPVELPG